MNQNEQDNREKHEPRDEMGRLPATPQRVGQYFLALAPTWLQWWGTDYLIRHGYWYWGLALMAFWFFILLMLVIRIMACENNRQFFAWFKNAVARFNPFRTTPYQVDQERMNNSTTAKMTMTSELNFLSKSDKKDVKP